MKTLLIEQFTCRQDNFGVLVHDPMTGDTAAIDAPDAAAIESHLDQSDWRLTHLLITHHHTDHVEGIPALREKYDPLVIGPESVLGNRPGEDKSGNVIYRGLCPSVQSQYGVVD